MDKNKRISTYQAQLDKHERLLEEAKKKSFSLSMLRLAIFSCAVLAAYFSYPSWLALGIIVVGIVLFVLVVHKWLDAKEEKERQRLFIELNKNEIALHYGDWSNFEDGEEFKNPAHAFSNDMDLFGAKSFYQLANRTVLPNAKALFANSLMFGAANTKQTNEVIEALKEEQGWCQEFIVESQLSVGDQTSFNALSSIEQLPKVDSKYQWLKWLIVVLFFCATSSLVFGVISEVQYMLIIFLNFGIVGRFLKKSNSIIIPVKEKISQVRAVRRQLELIQKLKGKHQVLEGVIEELTGNESSALVQLQKLERIQKRFEFRDNLLMGTILNLMFGWDFLVLTMYQRWYSQNKGKIQNWEDKVAQMEVWISGSVYYYNHPNSTFCEFVKEDSFVLKELGHPFVDEQKMVANTMDLQAQENFLITTGPNMAGKSTYLRSVGLAICSANAGLPILAEKVQMPRVKLYSSMRTSDNLNNESSYFHAELSRLRFIMDAIEDGGKTFIILDEILKGTNSKDKEIGSAKFLQKLVRLKTKGIIATHDLSLTKLAIGNDSFRNVYFDSTINGKELSFDYQLREGVCQNMNASFLLKQMELVDE